MSKTFRKISNDSIDFVDEKKIKKNDKKHQQVIVSDGAYSHPCFYEIKGDGSTIGWDDDYDGVKNPKDKKIVKHKSVKNQRNFNKKITKEIED
jgi:hypothetical protein